MERTLSFDELMPRIMPIPESGCWVWEGYITTKGYGELCRKRGPGHGTRRVHRIVYELLRGPIPAGLELDHLCRVRCCVNPDHLEIVTTRENTLRGKSPTIINKMKTHCVHGHEFTPENTRRRVGGGRACRACHNIQRTKCKQRARARKAQQ